MASRFKIFSTRVGKSVIKKTAKGFKGSLIGGLRDAQHNLKVLKKLAPEAFAAALLDQGIMIMDKSVPEAPRLTGDLRRSALVKAPKTTKRPEVGLSYNVEYALIQHETHKSRSKFLERPYNESLPKAPGNIADNVRKHLKKGTKLSSLKDKTYESEP